MSEEHEMSIKKLFSKDDSILSDENEWLFTCPFCKEDYVHLMGVRVRPVWGHEELKIDNRVQIDHMNDDTYYQRGSSIIIHMSGECGHKWVLELKFCKGQTTFFLLDEKNEWKAEGLYRD
jgi:hypothetical protein